MESHQKSVIEATHLNKEYGGIYEEIEHFRETKMHSFVKRTLDILLTIIGLPIALILIIIFSVLIKLETPGPAFYVQKRVGLNGRYFNLYKLRSMYDYAEKHGAVWAEKNDPRVTKVGKFIRKTRID